MAEHYRQLIYVHVLLDDLSPAQVPFVVDHGHVNLQQVQGYGDLRQDELFQDPRGQKRAHLEALQSG